MSGVAPSNGSSSTPATVGQEGGRRKTVTVKALKKTLKKAGLKTSGKKATLRARAKKARLMGGAEEIMEEEMNGARRNPKGSRKSRGFRLY